MRLPVWKGVEYREEHELPASKTRICIRPLSQIEMDYCYAEALNDLPREAQETVVKIHTRVMESSEPFPRNTRISDVQKYYNEVCYRIFVMGTKWYDKETDSWHPFSIEDIVNIPYGDNLKSYVDRIFRISGWNKKQAQKDIEWFIHNSDGNVLARIITEFKVPLVSEAWKLTPLQYVYLNAKDEADSPIATSTEDLVEFFKEVSQIESGSDDTGRSSGTPNSG